ncbi:MAG: hypothetical protein AAFU73_05280 [Planctomycetota bacterium]
MQKARSFIPKLTPTTALLAASVLTNATLLATAPSSTRVSGTLQTERLEVVSPNGAVCAVLSASNKAGGALELYYPEMPVEPGKMPIYASISSPFTGLSTIALFDTSGGGRGVSLTSNNDSAAALNAVSNYGTVSINAGLKNAGDALIEVTNPGGRALFRQ